MIQRWTWWLVLATLTWAGCATRDYLASADQQLLAGDAQSAVSLYGKAFAQNPTLRQDPAIAQRYKRARGLAAQERGEAAANRGEWQLAVDELAAAKALLPDHAGIEQAHSEISRRAARDLYRQALTAADSGDRPLALGHLRQALQFDPGHVEAAAALDYAVQGEGVQPPASVSLVYSRARSQLESRQWLAAQQGLQQVIQTIPTFIPARLAMATARTNERQARDLAAKGDQAKQQQALTEAIDYYQRCLAIWPDMPGASASLKMVEADKEKVEAALAAARQAMERAQWKQALEEVRTAKRLYPQFGEVEQLGASIRRQAADAQVASGHTQLNAGRLDEARAAFQGAFAYIEDYQPALEGLAAADAAAGRQMLAAQRPGMAWIWFRRAQEWGGDDAYASEIADLEARIHADLDLAVQIGVRQRAGVLALVSMELEAQLEKSLDEAPPYLDIDLTTSRVAERRPDIVAEVEIRQFETTQKLLRDEGKTKDYTGYRLAPNPELPRLQFELEQAERELERLQEAYNKPCRTCQGTGKLDCRICQGRGWIECATCNGSGKQGEVACRTCRGSGRRNCRQCKQGQITCKTCRGSGREGEVSLAQVRRQERKVRQLQNKYDQAPDSIKQPYTTQWPYRVKTYGRKTTVVGAIVMREIDDRRPFLERLLPVEQSVVDATTDNPNPDIGVPEDPLVLPDEQAARADAVAELADQAYQLIVGELTGRELDFWLKSVRRARHGADRIEAQVHVLFLQRTQDAGAAEQLENKLLAR